MPLPVVVTATYRFGRLELNAATREILVDRRPAPLGARAFDVLLALIERRDRLVTKNELLDLVWPGLVVEENNLQVQVSALRKLLGPDAITTVATRGYRFMLEPTDAAVSAPLSLQGPKHNLPAQTTQLIGREREIRAVREQLSKTNVRLLTLSGVGGTGKTRLALQSAADMVDEFEHGIFFISLAALGDPALVVPTIAKTFGLREAAGRPLLEQLQEYLRDKQMLLMLDNFEQVIEAAPHISELLTTAVRLKVLVTSREVLRLSGETDYPVPPLSLPDLKRLPLLPKLSQYEAVALFIERAAAVKPTFRVTNENAPAVAEICHRLDGLPLAIELAAARARVLPPERMLAELSHRLNFLTSGSRDLPTRQKTLRGAIDWSHDLLTTAERQLFRRLGVFVGGCTLESIETVCNAENELSVLETVESLVGKSLVKEIEGQREPRFAMLETIREYANDELVTAREAEGMRERHRNYFLALAEDTQPKLEGAEQATWLQRLDEEDDNLRSALAWGLAGAESRRGLRLCAALQRFWWTRGHLSEGRTWCARVLGKTGAAERTPERAKALNVAGVLAFYQGDYPAARAQHEECLAIWRELNDRRGIASSMHNLGNVADTHGDLASARALFEESLAISRELGDRGGTAASLSSMGNIARKRGELASARALFDESLAIYREVGDQGGIAITTHQVGMVIHLQGDFVTAMSRYEESMAIRRNLGDRRGIASLLYHLGEAACARSEFSTARSLFEESLAISRDLGSRWTIAAVLHGLASVSCEQGQLGSAHALCEESLVISRELGNRTLIEWNMQTLGALAFLQGDTSSARAMYKKSLSIGRELGDRLGIAKSLEALAAVVAALDSTQRAAHIWGATTRFREEIGSPMAPNERPRYDREVAVARAALVDDGAFDRAWQEGRALALEQAIELALEETGERE